MTNYLAFNPVSFKGMEQVGWDKNASNLMSWIRRWRMLRVVWRTFMCACMSGTLGFEAAADTRAPTLLLSRSGSAWATPEFEPMPQRRDFLARGAV